MSQIQTSLAIPTQPWEAAKSRFLQGLSSQETNLFNDATLENLFYDASAAQKKHAHDSRSWIRQQRLSSLVDAINEYGQAMDVYVNTYGLILSPIWGSVRVVLHIAGEAGKFQENTVEMLAQIGDALPRFQIYQTLFRNHERLLVALADVFLDVLNFCVLTKDFFTQAKKSLIPLFIVLKGAWKPFRRQFEIYMDNFRKHCKRVEKEAGLAHMVESARNREVQRANRALQLRNDKLQRLHRLLTAIPSVDYWNKHSKLSSLRHPGTNMWIQKTSQYASWYTSAVSDCLCYLGIPGSGKSVLAASLVNDLSGASNHRGIIILYYYFDYAEVASLEPTHFVASLIKQCLEHMPLDQFSENFTSPYSDSMSAPTISICVDYLIRILHDFSKIYMVLDGLDELTPSSQTMVLDLINNLLGDNSLVVKVLVTSRPEELFIKKTLQSYRTIQSAKDMVCGDIALFIEEEMIVLVKQNPLLSNARLRREVVGSLLSGADGMFLWVKFQLFDIAQALTETAVRNTLRNLPKDIQETYARIVQKAYTSSGSTVNFETMLKVLQWVAGARRPLRLDELEQAVSIEPTDQYFHADRSLLNAGDRLVACCHNLVVYNERDSTVSFVHHTVQQFVIAPSGLSASSKGIRISSESLEEYIAEICLSYLSFADFETQLVKTEENISVEYQQAEEIVWYNVPLAAQVRTLLSWSRGWRNVPRPIPATAVKLSVPVLVRPSNNLTRKYVMLEYIITYWVFHASNLREHSRMWSIFENIVLHRRLGFSIHPWLEQDHRERVHGLWSDIQKDLIAKGNEYANDQMVHVAWFSEQMLLYAWAVGHGVGSLLALVKHSHLDAYRKSSERLLQSSETGPTAWAWADLHQKGMKMFVTTAIDQSPSQLDSKGFWTGRLIASLVKKILQAEPVQSDSFSALNHVLALLNVTETELQRWAQSDEAFKLQMFRDAMISELQDGNMHIFEILMNHHIRDWNQFVQLLAAVIHGGHMRHVVLLRLLRITFMNAECPDECQWELMYALEQCLPEIRIVLSTVPRCRSIMPAALQAALFHVLLLESCCPSLLELFIGEDEQLKSIPRYFPKQLDWEQTIFGSAELQRSLETIGGRQLDCDAKAIIEIASTIRRLNPSFHSSEPVYFVTEKEKVEKLLLESPQIFNANGFEGDGIHGLEWALHSRAYKLAEILIPYYREFVADKKNIATTTDIVVASASAYPRRLDVLTAFAGLNWPPMIYIMVMERLGDRNVKPSRHVPAREREMWLDMLGIHA